MDRKREQIHALLTQTYTQNKGKDNNSLAENAHMRRALGEWIEREEIHALFNTNTCSKQGTRQQLTG